MQPERDCAVPMAGNTPAKDLIMDGPEDGLAQSVADIALPHRLPSIDNVIDQLTAELAAFCIDQLERSLTLSNEDHEVGDTDDLEDELQVRFKP